MKWAVSLFIMVNFALGSLTATLDARQTVFRAAIDFGSGAVKLQVNSVDPIESRLVGAPLLTRYVTINLIEHIATHEGSITEEMQEKIVELLREFKEAASAAVEGSELEFSALATEVFRRAENGALLLQKMDQKLGLHFHIISQEEEGKLGFMTAKALYPRYSGGVAGGVG